MGIKKVLYLSYDGLTDPLGQSQILPYIKGLSKLGYKFTVLSCEKPDRFKKLKNQINDLCVADNIEWISFPYSNKFPIISKIWDRFKFHNLAEQLYFQHKFDLIHCRSYVAAEIGLRLKKKYGVKFLFDMRGFWPDEKVDSGSWSQNNIFYYLSFKYYKYKEKEYFIKSDAIISLTFAAINEIRRIVPNENLETKIKVIPCCVDTEIFNPETIKPELKSEYLKRLNIAKDDFIVSYIGSIGTWYMLNEMMDFFKVLTEKISNSKFLIVTKDNNSQILKEAKKREITDKILIVSAERIEVPYLLSISNFSLFFIRQSFSKIASSPTKQFEIMAMGVPAICNGGIGDTELIINKFMSGIIINSFELKEYQKITDKLLNFKVDSQKIRNYALDNFSLLEGVNRYGSIYSKIIDER